MKPKIHNAEYLLNDDLMEFESSVEIHVSRFHNNQRAIHWTNPLDYKVTFDDEQSYKVLLLSNEPSCTVHKESVSDVIKHHKSYDLILCTDKELLETCSNAILFPYGGTWLNKIEIQTPDSLGVYEEGIEHKFIDKQFRVSFLTTSHFGMRGYEMRKQIWNNKKHITTPTVFWSSSRFPTTGRGFSDTLHDGFIPNDLKDNLFYSQFSVVVENCIQENYFSEKLIDTLLTKTIPIYFGCPNIGKYFDTEGMLIFNDFDEFLQIINNLDETSYEKMKEKVELNFQMAKQYGASFSKRVCKVINDNLVKPTITNTPNVLLSIGILTVPQRQHYLNRLLTLLNRIIPTEYKNLIEIIVNSDDMIKTVGGKRNEILDISKGKYTAFIDDDDIVSDDYFTLILPELEKNIDGVGWYGLYYVNDTPIMNFNHANKNGGHFKENGVQYRPLNHLNPIKTSISKQIRFPEKNFGEDADFCDRLLSSGLIKTESNIDKVLYHYLWNDKETLTQK